jgi:pimeloyl-ACP methyl ester carboxylesterase
MFDPRHDAARLLAVGLGVAAIAGISSETTAGVGAARARLTVVPATALWDARLTIRASGLGAHQAIKVRVSERSRLGNELAGAATVTTDGNGSFAYNAAPLLSALRAVRPFSAGDTFAPRARIEVTIARGRRTLATTSALRILVRKGVRVASLTVAHDGIAGVFASPRRATGAPVIYLGGSEGGVPFPEVSWLLASHGHPTLALAYFREPGLPNELASIPLEYFVRGLDWLERRYPRAKGTTILLGSSRGAEAALLLASYFPGRFHDVAACSPSSIVFSALTPWPADAPAWTIGGKPLAYASQFGTTPDAAEPNARIPVEKIVGRIFLVAGGSDALWPSTLYAEDVVARVRAHGRAKAQVHEYESAGHAVDVMLPNATTTTTIHTAAGILNLGGTPAADGKARDAAWPLLLRFLGGR